MSPGLGVLHFAWKQSGTWTGPEPSPTGCSRTSLDQNLGDTRRRHLYGIHRSRSSAFVLVQFTPPVADLACHVFSEAIHTPECHGSQENSCTWTTIRSVACQLLLGNKNSSRSVVNSGSPVPEVLVDLEGCPQHHPATVVPKLALSYSVLRTPYILEPLWLPSSHG